MSDEDWQTVRRAIISDVFGTRQVNRELEALARLESQNQALQEALKPFAEVSRVTEHMGHRDVTALWSGDDPENPAGPTVRILLADVDRARNALSPTQETDPE